MIRAVIDTNVLLSARRSHPCDPDDTVFLLTALNGGATHLVTYDEDLANVGVFYPEFVTCRPLEVLSALRMVP